MQINGGAARMFGCQDGTIPNETYNVSVRFSRPMRARITEACDKCRTCCDRNLSVLGAILGFSVVFSVVMFVVVRLGCQQEPRMALESLRILNMAVYQNTTSGVPPWQVDSAFDVTLSTRNPHSITKCFTTFRRVIVRVQYLNEAILQQEVPLGFGLKPRERRRVAVELNGAHFQLRNQDLGPVLEAELQSST